ncbi:MAG: hypothetical protein ACI4XE_02065 [Acutalibacteraceae bacterium]
MKRIISILLCSVLLVAPFAPFAAAQIISESETETQYFEDGSYLTVTLCREPPGEEAETTPSFIGRILNMMKRLVALLTGQKSISRTKCVDYYDAKGKLLWGIYLTAGFTYNGKSAKCTKASISHDIFDSDWKLISSSCSKNGATATGCFSIRQYKLGVPLKLIEKTLTLTCSADGQVT